MASYVVKFPGGYLRRASGSEVTARKLEISLHAATIFHAKNHAKNAARAAVQSGEIFLDPRDLVEIWPIRVKLFDQGEIYNPRKKS